MAITLIVFRAQVEGLLSSEDTEISQLRRDRLIKAALEHYSQDRPYEVITDVTGDGGKYYDIASELSAEWVEGFSRILSIEYPAADLTNDESPNYLENSDWDDDYWQGGTRYLWLPNHAPAATEDMRIRYTAPYDWEASAVTEAVGRSSHGFLVDDYVYKDGDKWYEATDQRIATHQVSAVADVDNFTAEVLEADPPVGDFFAICQLAASKIAQAVAAKYSRTTDNIIAADSVNHLSRAQEWARRAEEFMRSYREHMGLTEVLAKSTGVFVDMDTAPDWPMGRQYIFRGPGTR
jgi:hypothetical protein